MKIIVLDTNIWLSELALMSPTGCAFSYYITANDFRIGLPEVVEEEAKYNIRKKLREYRSGIESDYRRLLAIFGKMKELVMPSDEDIERKTVTIFDFHKDRIIRMPFEIEAAKSSFEKTIKKAPPNSEKCQQFKDGVIWANCLEFAKSYDVYLVTDDKAFFEKRTYDKGLAENLLLEAQVAPFKISIYHELTELLEEIKCDLRIDEDQLIERIEKETYDDLVNLCERNQFNLENLSNQRFEVFATTDPKEVSVKFSLKYNLENKAVELRDKTYGESRGEFLLNTETYEIRNFIKHGEYVFWTTDTGELRQINSAYCYGTCILGHKTIEHEISYKLGEI